jgi:hypothetical protein
LWRERPMVMIDQERGAAGIGHRYVFSRKPNPAFLAGSTFDPALVRKDLLATRKVCEKNGCSLEYILKGISTVGHKRQRKRRAAEADPEAWNGVWVMTSK